MYYDGRCIRKNRYKIGDRVRVKTLPWIEGAVTKKEYRPYGDGTGWWAYKVGNKWWNERSLRKLPSPRRR